MGVLGRIKRALTGTSAESPKPEQPRLEPPTTAPPSPTPTRPAPRPTVAALARELLTEFPEDVPAEVLTARAEAQGFKPETVGRVVARLRDPQPHEPQAIRRRRVDVSTLRILDLSGLGAIRTRIKASAYVVSDAERERFGGSEYLLIREPNNRADPNAVAVYGKGARVGYLSAAKAAALAPLLDALPGDAFRVTGEGTTASTIRLWVDVPKMEPLRRFVREQG